MRTKITIVFETHGLGTVEQYNEWNEDLLEKIANVLELGQDYVHGRCDFVTFDIASVERLAEEPE
jgi:tryptophan synthase alpha subunit